MSDSNHPIWGLLRLTLICTTLTFVLWLNASKFDMTEFRSIAEFMLIAGGMKGAETLWQRRKGDL